MSLIRLLSIGQSLIGVNGQNVRYQMKGQSQLPKFNHPNQSPSSVQNPGSCPGLLRRFKRVVFGWRRPRLPEEGAFRSEKTWVQGTLSLERVRVARNDLRESDLWIVAARNSSALGDQKMTAGRSMGRNLWAAVTQVLRRVVNVARSRV